jgi:hypothetical protein
MSTKDDSILFGAKRAGITWLFKFEPSAFAELQAGAERFGMTRAEFVCRLHPRTTGAPELSEPLKFESEDRETSTLKIEVAECDAFTRRCLQRQAAGYGLTVEEYIRDTVFSQLRNDEEDSFLDQSGEVFMQGREFGDLVGINVERGAQLREGNVRFTRIPVPAWTIVEQCA